MSRHRAARRPRVPRLAPIVGAAAVIALGMSSGFSLPSPAASQAVLPADERPAASSAVGGVDRLVVYGHSMPTGGGASAPSLGYAQVVAATTGLQLLNRAEGKTVSETTAEAMATFFRARPGDAVLIHTGMNDIIRRGDDAALLGREAIEGMLSRSSEATVVVLVLECRPPSWANTPAASDRHLAWQAWNDMLVEEAAAAGDVVVLDTCAEWDPERYVNPGKYHPNDDGHALIAQEIIAALSGREGHA